MASASSARSRIPRPNITTRRHTPQTAQRNPDITENSPPAINHAPTTNTTQIVNDDRPYDDPDRHESGVSLVPPPMVNPATATWNLPISEADLTKMKAGYESHQMEDKWDIRVQDPDPDGGVTFRISRSWEGIEHYLLHTVPNEDGAGHKIESITWSQNIEHVRLSEEQAKIDAIILCRGLLDCVFLDVPYLDSSLMYTYPDRFVSTEAYLNAMVRQYFRG
ncbi:hypothetical protein BDZ85DRAFT_321980 [Elsinoe ampelina]|uniref:Uncharacterized protein n=1 Tax=Elsinoe ampelina TaxID=302913 RepID=A0A6A6G2T0_9PEZI|nr:hypothetical protein BDZ85DRAFT_321980 [Elsinoe ampelina]